MQWGSLGKKHVVSLGPLTTPSSRRKPRQKHPWLTSQRQTRHPCCLVRGLRRIDNPAHSLFPSRPIQFLHPTSNHPAPPPLSELAVSLRLSGYHESGTTARSWSTARQTSSGAACTPWGASTQRAACAEPPSLSCLHAPVRQRPARLHQISASHAPNHR